MAKSSKSHATILTGIVKRHPDGFGFLIPDEADAPDVYIPRHEMTGVMGNDRVEVRVQREAGGNRFRGEIQKVLARAVKRVTGKYEDLGGGRGCLRDRSFAWGSDVALKNPLNLSIKPDDWVSADVLTYPDSPEGLSGQIIGVISNIMDPLNDSIRMLHMHNIPHEFSKRALSEADALPAEVNERDFQGRKDLRDLKFITIDGRTAKDFDDAIYIETMDRGFKLWVAIADVSHYVKPGTNIDEDAYERGTSTYFPNFVAPMLPEKLSNELCSLKPKVPRLAFVAEMQLGFEGELRHSNFFEAVIESKARVTYGEAQEVLDGATPDNLKHVEPVIRRAGDLAKILMAKRFKDGSLDLEIPETEIEVDDSGQPVDILQSSRLFSHRLIEEMMLTANVAVAREFTRRGVPALYRVHDEPNVRAMEALEKFLETLGSKRKLQGGSLQKKITRALEEFADHPQEHILHILTLRSMAQAQYRPENVGHFGLGFPDYAHFTSPIRRYPDLVVHRQLKALLKIGRGYQLRSLDELATAGMFLSACEQRSVKAERQIKSIKKARFMSKHLGQEFEGLISSVTRFGVFVILRQFDVDGLVRLESLPGDRFEFDEKNMRLVGRRSGRVIAIGDLMKVQVAAADTEEGRIDFLPAGVELQVPAKPKSLSEVLRVHSEQKKNKPPQKRGKGKSHSERLRKKRFSSGRRKGKARSVHS
jgi:ribonuclease R